MGTGITSTETDHQSTRTRLAWCSCSLTSIRDATPTCISTIHTKIGSTLRAHLASIVQKTRRRLWMTRKYSSSPTETCITSHKSKLACRTWSKISLPSTLTLNPRHHMLIKLPSTQPLLPSQLHSNVKKWVAQTSLKTTLINRLHKINARMSKLTRTNSTPPSWQRAPRRAAPSPSTSPSHSNDTNMKVTRTSSKMMARQMSTWFLTEFPITTNDTLM